MQMHARMKARAAGWTGVAVAVAVSAMAVPMIHAQQTPSLEDVRYNMADALGMLRHHGNSPPEEDLMMSVEIYGSGSMAEVGPTGVGPLAELESFYAEIAYDFPGMRVDLTRASGEREIQVVSGLYAWNEIDERGGGLVEGYGSAEPAMDEVADRLLHIWMTPAGAVKMAVAAGDQAQVSMEGGAVVVTFPLFNGEVTRSTNLTAGPLEGTQMKVTLDDAYRPAKVEVEHRGLQLVNTYSGYADLNESDYRADIFLPANVMQTIGGQTVLDLTIERTNTYNPYVIMPVPDSVRSAAQ
jgi:hypothetical protein